MDNLFIVSEETESTTTVVETESAGRETVGVIWLAAVGAPVEKINCRSIAEAEAAYAAYQTQYQVGRLAIGHFYAGEMLVARITRDGVRWSPEAIESRGRF